MLDEITVTKQPSVISVRLDGHPYLVTFTGRIGICFLGGVVMMYPESEDGSVVKVKHDREYADRERRRAEALAEAMPSAINRIWWHGRWPVYQHSLRDGADYIDGLVESAREKERERCAKIVDVLVEELIVCLDPPVAACSAAKYAVSAAMKIRKPA